MCFVNPANTVKHLSEDGIRLTPGAKQLLCDTVTAAAVNFHVNGFKHKKEIHINNIKKSQIRKLKRTKSRKYNKVFKMCVAIQTYVLLELVSKIFALLHFSASMAI